MGDRLFTGFPIEFERIDTSGVVTLLLLDSQCHFSVGADFGRPEAIFKGNGIEGEGGESERHI